MRHSGALLNFKKSSPLPALVGSEAVGYGSSRTLRQAQGRSRYQLLIRPIKIHRSWRGKRQYWGLMYGSTHTTSNIKICVQTTLKPGGMSSTGKKESADSSHEACR